MGLRVQLLDGLSAPWRNRPLCQRQPHSVSLFHEYVGPATPGGQLLVRERSTEFLDRLADAERAAVGHVNGSARCQPSSRSAATTSPPTASMRHVRSARSVAISARSMSGVTCSPCSAACRTASVMASACSDVSLAAVNARAMAWVSNTDPWYYGSSPTHAARAGVSTRSGSSTPSSALQPRTS